MLNQQWGLIVWTLITFGIALFVLWRFAFGPIQKLIDERRAHISESIETADETRAEAARLLAEYRETLVLGEGRSRRYPRTFTQGRRHDKSRDRRRGPSAGAAHG